MEIALDKKSNTSASLKITINEADYQPQVEKKLKDYSKRIVLKGFRPGKVPPQLVKKMYGKGILAEEVQSILSDKLFGYIRENELPVVGDPMPDNEAPAIDFENQKDFEFVYRLGLVSDFKIDLDNLAVTNYQIQHTDEQIQEIIDDIREQHGTHDHPEVSEANDLLSGELKQILPTPAEDEASPEAIEKKVYISLKQTTDTATPQFLGLSKGAVVKVDLKNLFKDGDKGVSLMLGIEETEVASLDGEFEFTLDEVHRTIPAEMNEEFFKKVFGDEAITTEEAFLEKLKTNIAGNYQNSADYYIERQVRKQLVANTEMELPIDFLKEWLTTIENGKFTPEQVEKEFDAFLENLKWDLIKNRVTKEQQFKIEHEEIVAQARKVIATQFGGYMPNFAENDELAHQFDGIVNRYLEGGDGRNYQNVVKEVLENKVVDYLKSQVTPTNQEITREEFEKLYYEKE